MKRTPMSLTGIPIAALIIVFMLGGLLLNGCKKDDDVDAPRMDMQLVADGFVSPIGLVSAPDNTGRLFVIDQAGKIWIIEANGNKLPTPFMDVTPMLVTLSTTYD